MGLPGRRQHDMGPPCNTTLLFTHFFASYMSFCHHCCCSYKIYFYLGAQRADMIIECCILWHFPGPNSAAKMHPPLLNTGRPVRQTGRPVRQTGRPVRQTGRPVRQTGRSIRQTGRPVRQTGRPVRQIRRSIRQTGRHVRQTGRTVRQTGRPVR